MDLVEWAEHQFKLNKPDQNGIPERDHLEQVYKQTGRMPKGLEEPVKFPILLSHVWSAFLRLNSSRSIGFSGPNAITYLDIKAFMEVTDTPLSAKDVDAIKELDNTYMRVQYG